MSSNTPFGATGEVMVLRTKRTNRKPVTQKLKEKIDRMKTKIQKDRELRKAKAYLNKGKSARNPINLASDSESDLDYDDDMLDEGTESKGEPKVELPIVVCSKDASQLEDEARLMPKLEDPGAFILEVTLNGTYLGTALVDSGSNLNIFPKSLCERNLIMTPVATPLETRFADSSRTVMTGLLKNMIIGIGQLRFKIDILVMDIEENRECPIILGRSFMNTSRALISMARHEIDLFDAKGSKSFGIMYPRFPVPVSVHVVDVCVPKPEPVPSLEEFGDEVKDEDEKKIPTILRKNVGVQTEPSEETPTLKPKDRRKRAKKRTRRVHTKAESSKSDTSPKVIASLDGHFECLFIGCTSRGKALIQKEGKTLTVKANRVKTWKVKDSS